MPILAFNSTSILDSTSIGRDLLTAVDQAAAQAAIGVTPFDVDADHDWGGFNTFEFLATFEGGINTNAITSTANIVTTMSSGGQGQYYFGANPIYLMSATEFRPAEVGTSASLGSDVRRWTDVYSVDGSFSGNLTSEVGGSYKLYNLGDESAADTEYLEFETTGNAFVLAPKATGGGAVRSFTVGSGNSGVTYNLASQQTIFFAGGASKMQMSAGGTYLNDDIFPNNTGVQSCGNTNRRWAIVGAVDGDFSGNITAENLPTSDPGVPGQFYVTTGGALKVSQ